MTKKIVHSIKSSLFSPENVSSFFMSSLKMNFDKTDNSHDPEKCSCFVLRSNVNFDVIASKIELAFIFFQWRKRGNFFF